MPNPRRRPNRRPPAPGADPAAARGTGATQASAVSDAPVRLQKLLAAAGLGSRREIEEWIAAGRVTIAGRAAKLGDRASRSDAIYVDGRPVRLSARRDRPRVLAYHKPVGQLVTRSDPEGRETIFDRLPRLEAGKWVAVGRLDLNSSGLLLVTDSGELANRLMHPRHGYEREYAVRARGIMDDAKRRRLLTGVRLDDGRAKLERIDEAEGGAGASAANRWYRVALREGRNREVRRLFEAVGLQVSRLVRTRFGPVLLPKDLAPGAWRELDPRAVDRLLRDQQPARAAIPAATSSRVVRQQKIS